MAQTDIEQLIAAELLGETLSAEERRQLDAWLDEEPAHREQYARIRMARFSAARYDAYRQINADRAYHDFLKKTRRASRRKLYMQIAAACLVPLFIIAGSIWVKHYDKALSEPVAAIMPGTTHAVLQTAAGDSIVLNRETLAQAAVDVSGTELRTTPRGLVMPSSDVAKPASSDNSQNVLRTAENGEFYVMLEDGTVVHLNYNTTLRYPEHFSDKERMVYLEGEAYFEVAADEDRPFKVMTRDVTIRQYGTSFNVNTYSKHVTEVVLVSGSIGVQNEEEEYMLKPNDRMRMDSSSDHLSIEPVDVKPYVAWHEGRFVFDNESLGDIMETLSHWYAVDVVFDNPALRDLHFTGNMDRYGKLSPILRSISQTVGLRIVIKNRTIYIYQ